MPQNNINNSTIIILLFYKCSDFLCDHKVKSRKGISQEIFCQRIALLTLLYLEYTVAPDYMYSDPLGTTGAAFLYDHRLKGWEPCFCTATHEKLSCPCFIIKFIG